MSGSLRDQLLKAGFVDKKKADKSERERRQQNRQATKARKSGQPVGPTPQELAAQKAEQERALHAQRSRELNREREQKRARKALRAEVKDLLDQGALVRERGEVRYHFVERGKVKRVYVDKEQQKGLSEGNLAIAKWEGVYHLVPVEVAGKIEDRMPEVVVFRAEPQEPDPDDPYAAYPIPDDLEW